MVTRGTYYDEDDHLARRYNSRGHGYPLNHERDQPLPSPQHGPYARQNMSTHNLNNRQSPEQDTSTAPRRRIPVACGRCRKRKIRCSGDPGNGQPCTGCKGAGNDTCQFLRVSSTEATLKNDGTDFGYDSTTATAVSRVHCRMSQYGPQHQSYTPHITPLGQDFSSYRHNSMSAYQPIKYFGVQSYNEFPDENVDYGLPVSNYSLLNQEPISIPYTTARWSQPQHPKTNSLFVEQDAPYNHLPSYPNPFPYRPNTESKSLSLHSMANALSPSVSGTDRLLPAPAPVHYRTSQVPNSYLRTTENPLSQAPVYNHNGLMTTQMQNAVKALSGSSSSDSMSSSNYLSSSPPESVPSSHMSYATQSNASAQNHESYVPSHNTQPEIYQHPSHSLEEINYVSGPIPRRSSITGQDGEESSNTARNGSGSLVNRYEYSPVSGHVSYPQPPMPVRLSEQATAQTSQRQPVSAT